MKIWAKAQNVINAVLSSLILAMIALLFFNTVCRYLFNHSFAWCDEVIKFSFVAVVFLGVSILIRNNVMLRVDIIDVSLRSERAKDIYNALTLAIGFLVQVVFGLSGIKLVQAGVFSTSPALSLPMYCIYWVVPAGYFLAAIETLNQIVRRIGHIIKGGREKC